MIWLAILLGIVLTVFGATAGAALITVSRAELTRAVGRRLRGGAASLAELAQIDKYLTAASATTSLGVLLLGASVPALLAGSQAPRLVVAFVLLAVPLVLFAAYLVPRYPWPAGSLRYSNHGRRSWDCCFRLAQLPARLTCAPSGGRVPRLE
ncbi:MAG: hypothetical protein K0S19_1766 [Geminicoccaceae bacterium]|nr:hypothetical protein [Geminicoccaceae bacterium]